MGKETKRPLSRCVMNEYDVATPSHVIIPFNFCNNLAGHWAPTSHPSIRGPGQPKTINLPERHPSLRTEESEIERSNTVIVQATDNSPPQQNWRLLNDLCLNPRTQQDYYNPHPNW